MVAFFSALLQVNSDLKTIGALAGVAAVPGLGVLALLYFGQAREVRRLREWAGRAPERAAELEARVTAGGRQRGRAPRDARRAGAAQARGRGRREGEGGDQAGRGGRRQEGRRGGQAR